MVFSTAAILAGCANTGPTTDGKQSNSSCLASYSQAKYSDYTFGSLQVVKISETDRCMALETGISRVAGFRLNPLTDKDRILETVTEYEGFWLPMATVFVPRFIFLDESFKVLSASEPELYQRTGRLYQSGPPLRAFYGACFIPPKAKYFLLHTDASSLDTKTVTFQSPGGAGASGVLERAETAYKSFDKRAFASGQIRKVGPSTAFLQIDMARKPIGVVRVFIAAE